MAGDGVRGGGMWRSIPLERSGPAHAGGETESLVLRIISASLLVGLLGLAPVEAGAQVTLTDWMGRSATFEKGEVDSDGVAIVVSRCR